VFTAFCSCAVSRKRESVKVSAILNSITHRLSLLHVRCDAVDQLGFLRLIASQQSRGWRCGFDEPLLKNEVDCGRLTVGEPPKASRIKGAHVTVCRSKGEGNRTTQFPE